MKITLDLDDVIFNTGPLFNVAFKHFGLKFFPATDWDLYKCYPDYVVEYLYNYLFGHDMLYTMPIQNRQLAIMLNDLIKNSEHEILFVTERKLKQPLKTFQQLQNAGIKCSLEQVYDKNGKKSDILRELQPDLHFDDSPSVIKGCIEKHVPIVMISNNFTLYNHYLRNQVEYYRNLRSALIGKGVYNKNNILTR